MSHVYFISKTSFRSGLPLNAKASIGGEYVTSLQIYSWLLSVVWSRHPTLDRVPRPWDTRFMSRSDISGLT